VAKFTVSASCAAPGVSITFNASTSTHATSWNWDFDDGSGSGKIVTHAFGVGTYVVILTVSGPGGTDFKSRTINVPC
jgi:PKD repeat protein